MKEKKNKMKKLVFICFCLILLYGCENTKEISGVACKKFGFNYIPLDNFCTYCGDYEPYNKFCHKCGRKQNPYSQQPWCSVCKQRRYAAITEFCGDCGLEIIMFKKIPR